MYNLSKQVEDGIIDMAKRHRIGKIILFGSRARGTNRERSDIDLAVSGGECEGFFL